MNWVRRAVAEIASRNRTISHPNSLNAQSYFSTKPTKAVVDWPKPSEIPYQVKVANSINIIGYVDMAVQFRSSDGKDWAATIVNQIISKHSPPLWIPVIFEGDLAHIAASHLKPNDHVHIAGELIADLPTHNEIQRNANVQVMVHSVNFIEVYSQKKKSFVSHKQKEAAVNDSVSTKKDGVSEFSSWYDLLDNPKEWWDCRSKKLKGLVNPKYPDFKRKDNTVSLWLNSAPKRILPKLEGVEFDVHTDKPKYLKQHKVSTKKDGVSNFSSWSDLLDNPKEWQDCRNKKLKGLVNPKYPDFKRKDGTVSLWLGSAPKEILPKLEGVEFDVHTDKSKYPKQHKGEESWKDLVENPNKWWDNRLDKRKEKSPDFVHKETGAALWLTDSPAWVLSKLPAPKSKWKLPTAKGKQNAVTGKTDTLLS